MTDAIIQGSQSALRIVALAPAYYPALRVCAAAVWHAAYDDLLPPGQVDHMLAERLRSEVFQTYLDAADRWFDLAVDQSSAVVGYTSCRMAPETSVLVLEQLYVGPDHWGAGIADFLIAAVAQHGAKCGATSLELRVNKGNARAQGFYRKRGFTVSGEVLDDIGGGYVMDDFVMAAPVPPVDQEPQATGGAP